jgi:hypothetical protein
MKVRASQIGKIMATPRKAGEVLSETAKTYVHDLVLEEKYGIKKEFSSRYTDKGNEVEEIGIALVNEVLNYKFIYKNYEFFENDWVKGTPDVNTDEVLLDVKCSWDATTFPFFDTEVPNKDYFFQLQGYMWLTGKQESILAYCLINTPFQMVEDEIRRAHWKFNLIEENTELRKEVESKHVFDHIPEHKRVKYWFIRRDESVIEKIKERVELCREYYNLLMKTI